MTAQELTSAAIMAVGTLLLLIAGIGILRMPDLFMRMSATSKASSLGAGCLLLAVAVSAADFGVTVRAVAGVAFLFLTTPVAAHMIGRAAYLSRVPLFEGMVCDELRGRYDHAQRRLHGSEEAATRSVTVPPTEGFSA